MPEQPTIPQDNPPQEYSHPNQAKIEKTKPRFGPFGDDALEEKRKALFEAMRQDRGVADPDKVTTDTSIAEQPAPEPLPPEIPTNSVVPPPAQPEPPPLAQNEREILQEYEARLRASMQSEASAEQKRLDAERLEREAAEKLAKIENAKSDPMAFLQSLGFTPEEWAKYLAETASLTPEMQRIQAVEKQAKEQIEQLQRQFEDYKQQMQQQQAEAARKVALTEAQQLLGSNEFALAAKLSSPEAIIERQQQMQATTGRQVSLQEAAQSLETGMRKGVGELLADSNIRAIFASKPQSEPSTAAQQPPTTLNSVLSSATSPSEGEPHPLDFETKRMRFLEKLKQSRLQ